MNSYFIAVFLASGFLDGILTTVFANVEFWKALPHSIVTCMLFSRYTVQFFRWIWWEVLSEATRHRLSVCSNPIFEPLQAEDLRTIPFDRVDAIALEQGTHQPAAIEPAPAE